MVLPNVFTINNPVNAVEHRVLPVPGLFNRTISYLSSFIFVFCLKAVSTLALILSTCAFTSSRSVILMRELMTSFKAAKTGQ